MFQSHIFMDIRILLSPEKQVFPPSLTIIDEINAFIQALSCKKLENLELEEQINKKNLPNDIQLSYFSLKLAENGRLPISFRQRYKEIEIKEIRLEEDAGRLTHSDGHTRMDYSTAGCPSLVMRTGDNFELGEEAEIFLDEIHRLAEYLNLSDILHLKDAIRCNAHVSLASYPKKPNYYVKLRNLNSFNFVRKAINSELSRQERVLSSGAQVHSESRLWREDLEKTDSYQSRVFSEQRQYKKLDIKTHSEVVLPFLQYQSKHISIELPETRRRRFQEMYGITRSRASFLCDEKSRADFFEESIANGASSQLASDWIATELVKQLKWANKSINNNELSSLHFAKILNLFESNQIHSGIAKLLIKTVLETGEEPEHLIEKNKWKQISDEKTLKPLVIEVLKANSNEAALLQKGQMAPLEFLTGLVMKKTEGLAHPLIVKQLIREQLKIRIVYLLSMGGSISAEQDSDGSVLRSEAVVLEKLMEGLFANFSQDNIKGLQYRIEVLGDLLSEELEPSDWANLLTAISVKMQEGLATGIIITHGTATLSYTSALLYWLFSDASVPIVLTASSETPSASTEAEGNLELAIELASQKKGGVYVVFNKQVYSPLNLKLEKSGKEGFRNWNLKKAHHSKSGPIAHHLSTADFDSFIVKQILKNAADSLFVCKIYPGMKISLYQELIEKGIRYFILELYETGTVSMKRGDYSLKSLLENGKKRDCVFYCTSQQESIVNFSSFSTSKRAWREGAIPMGALTTESVLALYFAVSLASDTKEEFSALMEQYIQLYS